MSIRVPPHACPPSGRWFSTWIQETYDGDEFRVAVLRLPSFQWMHSWRANRATMHQLAIIYSGRTGFSLEWIEAPER